MRFDYLLTPVAEDDPCGPDLDEGGDEAYLNYVLAAGGRIPESFYRRDPNSPMDEAQYLPFDRTSVDLKFEGAEIARLLGRTRDLRLLTLEARFRCLAGQVAEFCECLQAIAMLVEAHWDDVHPRAEAGEFTMRQNTLSGLDDQTSVLLPLTYAPLLVSKKLGPVTLRDHMLATRAIQPRAEDRAVELSDVMEALRSPSARTPLEALHVAVQAGLVSLKAVEQKFADTVGHENTPGFAGVTATLEQLRRLVETVLPDLVPVSLAVEPGADQEAADSEADSGERGGGTAPRAVVSDHAAASAALLAAEQYFARVEPSSPALILIHQARLLVGKPLVEALEMLMPEGAGGATIAFPGAWPLQLDMPKMKMITEGVADSLLAVGEEASAQEFAANTRAEAEALITSVDIFFRANEPSSPIPMLMGKARGFINRDFSAILSELMQSEQAPE